MIRKSLRRCNARHWDRSEFIKRTLSATSVSSYGHWGNYWCRMFSLTELQPLTSRTCRCTLSSWRSAWLAGVPLGWWLELPRGSDGMLTPSAIATLPEIGRGEWWEGGVEECRWRTGIQECGLQYRRGSKTNVSAPAQGRDPARPGEHDTTGQRKCDTRNQLPQIPFGQSRL